MKCPTCEGVDLVISERQGVEIDYCPKCRGVWLDRGELDKLIDRAARYESEPLPVAQPVPAHAPPPPPPPQYGYSRKLDDSDEHRPYDPQYDQRRSEERYRKRKSWWMEMFD